MSDPKDVDIVIARREEVRKRLKACIDEAEKLLRNATYYASGADYDAGCGDWVRSQIDDELNKARHMLYNVAECSSTLKKVDMALLSEAFGEYLEKNRE